MEIKILPGCQGLELSLNVSPEEFKAFRKAMMWVDFDHLDDPQKLVVEQINRNLARITLPE